MIPGLRSLRAKFLLVVFCGVVVPLAVVGFWLTGSAARSGQSLLITRLDGALDQIVAEAGARWVGLRAEMLDIGDDPAVQLALARQGAGPAIRQGDASVLVVSALRNDGNFAASLVSPVFVRDQAGNRIGRVGNTAPSTSSRQSDSLPGNRTEGIVVTVPVYSKSTGAPVGHVDSRLALESVVPVGAGGTQAAGVIIQVVDRSTGQSLGALPFDAALMALETFELGGERWLVRHRTLEEPALSIAAAAPLGAYTIPFESAARKGSLAILAVAVSAAALAVFLTTRLTRSLEDLASATDAVAAGDLNRRISESSADEVGRVGRAFNAMTESLHATVRKLAQRDALVAVGEFAASLAHEIRNPLTSIRIDLQRVEEKIGTDSELRAPLARALREVQRLDQTVSGALRIARSGNISFQVIDLRSPLTRAIEVSAPVFEQCHANLSQAELGSTPVLVRGDDAALEQLFINILLNAAQALEIDGKAGVSLFPENRHVTVRVWDSGRGIPADKLGNVFDAFYSTKTDGTGLGLSVARQIAIAHGGTIAIDSAVDSGTTVSIVFPIAE